MAFSLASVSNDIRMRAPKGIVYGPPGIGKTTFGAGSSGLLLDTENGIPFGLVVTHTPYLPTWLEMKDCLDWLVTTPEPPPAIVIDTVDWLLRRIEEQVSGVDGTVRGMTCTLNKSQGGYGNGKQVLRNYVYQYLLPTLDQIVNRGTSVILLAHTIRRELTSMEGTTFERSMPQIHDDLANVMIEWSDFVGAACMLSGSRSLILQETNQLVAKNRYGITNAIPFSWQAFIDAITTVAS